jgi:arylsulfatase
MPTGEIEMAKTGTPNILILWGDDIGWWNISYNSRGQMGYRTPNIDLGGQGEYNDVMVAHDEHIGQMLNKLDELGIADNTIVMYSTDNGPHYNSWPDAGITPFRSEKNTNWVGGWRVPTFVRWPAKFKAGTVLNGIVSHQDWLTTFLAAAGEPNIKEKLLDGHRAGSKTYKVHLDGYNMLPYLTGEVGESPRQFFFYISDDGEIVGLRMKDWKVVLMEQRAKTLACWFEPFVHLRAPKMFNLRRDPFERADENSNTYWDWVISHAYLLYGMQALVSQQIAAFVKFPRRQKPASFNLDAVLRKLQEANSSANHRLHRITGESNRVRRAFKAGGACRSQAGRVERVAHVRAVAGAAVRRAFAAAHH